MSCMFVTEEAEACCGCKELETNQKILVVKEGEKNGRVRYNSSAKRDAGCITRSYH